MNDQGQIPSSDDAGKSAPGAEDLSASRDTVSGKTNKPTVPDYELLRRIGRGAYGDVWLARNKATGALRAAFANRTAAPFRDRSAPPRRAA